MKKLTIFFLSATLGTSIFVNSANAANELPCPEYRDKLTCDEFDPWETNAMGVDWTGEYPGRPAWFCKLKKVIKELNLKPCSDCYQMMEPGDPRIPVGTPFVYECK